MDKNITKEHHTKRAHVLGYKPPGGGGGGTNQERALSFHRLLETGALFEIGHYYRASRVDGVILS